MKKAALIVIGTVFMAAGVNAGLLEKDTKSVRVDYVWTDDAFDESARGAEVGFGVSCYDMDDLAIYVSHVENGKIEMQQLGLSVEELFPIPDMPIGLVPFAGAAIGYGWLDVDGDGDEGDFDRGSMLARAEFGAKLFFSENFALNASARFYVATRDIFPDERDLEDTNWDFALGLRFYY